MSFLTNSLRRSLPTIIPSTSRSLLLSSSLPTYTRSFSSIFSSSSITRPNLLLQIQTQIQKPLPSITIRTFIMPKAISSRKKSSALARPKKTARRASMRKAKRRSKRMGQPN